MLFISTTITSPKQAKRDVRAAMMTYPSISWQKYLFLPYLKKYLALPSRRTRRFYINAAYIFGNFSHEQPITKSKVGNQINRYLNYRFLHTN